MLVGVRFGYIEKVVGFSSISARVRRQGWQQGKKQRYVSGSAQVADGRQVPVGRQTQWLQVAIGLPWESVAAFLICALVPQ